MRARALFFSFLLLLVAPSSAHHSTADYDLKHPAVATGVVSSFEWSNPHAHIYLNVSGEHWVIEIDSPNALRRLGWSKDSLQPGDKVTCSGARAKDGSPRMRCTQVELANGAVMQSF